ncbi:MAG: outer membrane lipoprotein carrier protein LolA [Candidatus Zixiibacteriota bacterium]|nr:MAG: outer membrane lipoprotein carrier protein LolA [candidate division Zixibacteria bacterium]
MRRLVMAAAFLIVPFVIITCVRSAKAVSSDELAQQVEKKYRSLKSLSVDFEKITRSEIFETESKIKGKMLLKNPDKFKIDTKDETIVCDGEFVWSYSVENQQVIKNLADRSENLFKPNQYLANFRSGYVPRLTGEEKIDRTRCYKLSLSPKEEDVFIKKMTIWVDKKKLLAKKLEYTDSNDNQVTLIFQRTKTNRKIKDSEFVFQTPPGVEELDLSE